MSCSQTAGWIKIPLGREVGLGPGHIVLHGDSAPPPPKGHSPLQFLAHACCGEMAGWIKMPLRREAGLSPSHIVLDGDPPSLSQKATAHQYSAHVYCGQTVAHLSYC